MRSKGVPSLNGVDHRVLGDRLEAETFAIAAAVTRGTVTLQGIDPEHLGAFLAACDRMGISYTTDPDAVHIRPGDGPLRAIDVRTHP